MKNSYTANEIHRLFFNKKLLTTSYWLKHVCDCVISSLHFEHCDFLVIYFVKYLLLTDEICTKTNFSL